MHQIHGNWWPTLEQSKHSWLYIDMNICTFRKYHSHQYRLMLIHKLSNGWTTGYGLCWNIYVIKSYLFIKSISLICCPHQSFNLICMKFQIKLKSLYFPKCLKHDIYLLLKSFLDRNWTDCFNSLWPCGGIWRNRYGSKLTGNGLLPNDTKPLPVPILTYHQ